MTRIPTILATAWLFASLPAAAQEPELRLVLERESLTGRHLHYRQFIDGREVIGGEVVRTIGPDGEVRREEKQLAVRSPLAADASAVDASRLDGDLVYLNEEGIARLVRREFVERRPMERFVRYLDPLTGALLREEPLFFTAKARVFEVNPVAKLNDPSLQDRNDSADAVPEQAYSTVELPGLGDLGPLAGPHVRITELEAPENPPIDIANPMLFDRGEQGFEAVNVYYHLDRIQRHLQALGYVGTRQVVAYPIEVDPHAANGTDNSYYLSGSRPGFGGLYFGEGGTDDGEDSDLVIHEYGHAIQDWIAPGAFGGLVSSESRALAEGFCDYWAFSAHWEAKRASGRDPRCFADWDTRCWLDDASQNCGYAPGTDCLRRLDSTRTMSDFVFSDRSGTEHANGQIWSSALREIFERFAERYGNAEGRRRADQLVIESHFGTAPNPTFRSMARKLLDADRLLFGGAHQEVVCSAMTARKILEVCERSPRGELTYFQSFDQGIDIPDNGISITSRLRIADERRIERLFVQVHITHPSRGDLRLILVSPDGTPVVLQNLTLDRSRDVHVTFGLDAQPVQMLDILRGKSAAGDWQLRMTDLQQRDVGRLVSWSLAIRFEGDAPMTSRPRSVTPRKHIAVVGHLLGANNSEFVSDVRIVNRGSFAQTVVLVYTPTMSDGTATFSAVKVMLEPQRAVAFDDIVARTFETVGMGQMEVLGGTNDLVVTSRTYTAQPSGGTFGQGIPAFDTIDAVGVDGPALFVPQLQTRRTFRSNYGFAEVAGSSGTVRVRLIDSTTGTTISETEYTVEPFGHRQLVLGNGPNAAASVLAEVRVVSGGARVYAYGSVVDNLSNDPIYIPGMRMPATARVELAPIIASTGAFETDWRSDVWLTSLSANEPARPIALRFTDADGTESQATLLGPGPLRALPLADILVQTFHRLGGRGVLVAELEPGVIATSRVWNGTDNGTFGQFIPFRSESDPAVVRAGLRPAELPQLEVTETFRTNIGLIATGESDVTVRVRAFDNRGTEVGSRSLTLAPHGLEQFPLRELLKQPLVNGRVSIDVISESGGVLAYASVIDNRSGDPTYFSAH